MIFSGRRISSSSLLLLGIFLALQACAAKRPVLYPNAHLYAVGETTAQSDIDQCLQLARDHGAGTGSSSRTVRSTAGGAAVGGAAGGAAGAVWGRPGRGAAAGAAGGAAGAMTRSLLDSGEPTPVFRNFVEKCLRDKGYAPIGWR